MRISVISDLHLGFSIHPETEADSYENALEAFQKALDSDIIIISGDFFDTKNPKPYAWYSALKLLSMPLLETSNVKLVASTKKLPAIFQKRSHQIPVIAIHGNHDRNLKGEKNIIEALEHAGLLIYLHRDTVVFEKNGERVAIHGMSHVPERFAYEMLKDWNPKPVENAINILVLHQNIDQYVYSPIQLPTITLDNLPEGFDIIVNGHVHNRIIQKFKNGYFIIPGSTIITQFQPVEAEVEKGIIKIDIKDKKINVDFVPLEKNRKFFYVKTDVRDGWKDELREKILRILQKNLEKKPIIKLKIIGKELNIFDFDQKEFESEFKNKAILFFSKDITLSEIEKKFEILRNLREQKVSIREMGFVLLKKNLEILGFGDSFDYERIMKILEDGNVDLAMDILLGNVKDLGSFLEKP